MVYATDRYWTDGKGFLDECECRDLANDDLWEDYDECECVDEMYSCAGDLWRAVCNGDIDDIRDAISDEARDESDYAFESTAEMSDEDSFEVYGREYYKLKEATFFF